MIADAYPVCHREERSDAAIPLSERRMPSVPRLPRFARNDRPCKLGTHEGMIAFDI